MINIKEKINNGSIVLTVYDEDENIIVTYSFKSRQPGTLIGIRMVLITLLRYSVMMTLNVDHIFINLELSEFEVDYINEQIDKFIDYAKINQNLIMQKPTVTIKNIVENPQYEEIVLDKNINFIGCSGGKDSQLCLEIVEEEFAEIRKFKIDFETEDFLNDYNERIDIIDQNKYNSISTSEYFKLNNRDYYQEEDLHCCFAIPYYSVKDGYPSSLTVGLQFDVVNSYVYDSKGNSIYEFDLLETYDSLKCFENLMHFYGLSQFKIIVPLASLTSFSIYNILKMKYGEEGIRKFNSCWNPEKNGIPCGKCIKCQRVSFIYNLLGMKLNSKEKEAFTLIEKNNVKLDYLFGSITCKNLLQFYNEDERAILNSAMFLDEKIEDLDWGINQKIKEKYHLIEIKNPLKEDANEK